MDNRTIHNKDAFGRNIFTATFDRYVKSEKGTVYLHLINIKNSEGAVILDSFPVDALTQDIVGSITLGSEVTFSALEEREDGEVFYLTDFRYISKKD